MTGASVPGENAAQSSAGSESPDDADPSEPRAVRLIDRLRGLLGRAECDDGTDAVRDAAPAQDQQRQLVANVHLLGDMRVSDAMVPRADIVAVDVAASFRMVVEAFRNEGHSRMPVYQDTLDDTLGFIHVKDVILACDVSEEALSAPSFMTRRYLRRLLTVPPSMRCGTLLQKMQAERVHMALVIDEFGGVDGIVTIEDLLEVIVGDIEDEHDAEVEAAWKLESDGVYRIDARTDLDDFERETGVRLLDDDKLDDVDTLGGLVFMLCNRVPARGEVVRHPDGHEFEILDADPRRIKQLLVTLASPEPAASEDIALQAAQ